MIMSLHYTASTLPSLWPNLLHLQLSPFSPTLFWSKFQKCHIILYMFLYVSLDKDLKGDHNHNTVITSKQINNNSLVAANIHCSYFPSYSIIFKQFIQIRIQIRFLHCYWLKCLLSLNWQLSLPSIPPY